jgi:hypothetical protein
MGFPVINTLSCGMVDGRSTASVMGDVQLAGLVVP